ncbi:MAG: AAA family ATPase [Candidatus Omnitrophica bacterium]|nr:AAA family ATPase [Candidatus Omnitrophota bacterium]
MYLRSLEIFGFKSFPEKVSLKFEPGITVVVGPNGCGKSNVFDAIKWALGEQSPKSLRGTKMEDIIFNGTEHFSPLNYAEVALTFANEDGYLPIGFKEVSVSRKLYRSGESEYYLNKNLARLKDVQELFMGTGIGESTYSFIEQGKIEIFLSYKPEEKRLIFDEASGIVKYKDRKKETLRKLQSTEENIIRLDDIIAEVHRQIRYLDRQVAKAKKYKDIEASLIEIEQTIANINYKTCSERIDGLNQELEKHTSGENEQKEALARLRVTKDDFSRQIQTLRDTLEEITSRIFSLNSKIELSQNTIVINRQRIEERNARISGIGSELAELKEKITFQDERIERETRLLSTIDGDVERLNQEAVASQKEKEALAVQVKEAQGALDLKKHEILNAESEKTNCNNELVEIQTHLKNIHARNRRLLLDKEKLATFFQERQESLAAVTEELTQLNVNASGLQERKRSLEEALSASEAKYRQLEIQRQEKEKQLIELRSYYDFLKDLRSKYGSFSSSKKVRVIFEEPPTKINKLIASFKDVQFSEIAHEGRTEYSAQVEAKVVLFEEEELKEKIDGYAQEILHLNETIQKEEDRTAQLKEEWKKATYELSEFDKRLGQKVQERENLQREYERVKEEYELLEREIEENTQAITQAQGAQSAKETQLKGIEENLTAVKTEMETIQQHIVESRQKIQELEICITRNETELVSLKENKESLLQRIAIFTEDKKSFLENQTRLETESRDIRDKISSFTQEIEGLENGIVQEKQTITSLETEKESLKVRQQELFVRAGGVASDIDGVEGVLQKIQADMYEVKMKIQESEFEKNKIVDYLKQVYHIDFSLKDIPQDIVVQELIEKRDSWRKKLDSLGEVNLVAIEESQELNQRYEFLEKQKGDLIYSSEELKKAIQKINRVSRQIFIDTFTKIREEFKKNFRYLFGGGRAELILLDENNVLESGVEIEVQPPGKKLQNVSLLSGGEKALTAISLIFAIFQIKPSPLCVLDEIDAPLDEANVDRFNQLLSEFAKGSQFVVITHNKKTMSNADVLYGVTMQEKGISKIVSVKFAQEPVQS